MTSSYEQFHQRRIDWTIDMLRRHHAERVIEMGGHPWVMTRRLLEAGIDVPATISAEECLLWPDQLPIKKTQKEIDLSNGDRHVFTNYSANLERSRFAVDEKANAVLATEIIEHMVRAPHVLLLNANDWLDIGGLLLLTTPNGASFQNPMRIKSRCNAFRYQIYERHTYTFERRDLEQLITLCGFDVVESGFTSDYPRQGPSRVYDVLARIPLDYMQNLFQRTVYVIARKRESLTMLPKRPSVYAPGQWEYIEPAS